MLDKIWLILLCLKHALVRDKHSLSASQPQKVLIVHFGKIGDIVCATPMFRAVKAKFPDCEVHVAGNAVNREVLQDNPDVDIYHVIEHDVRVAAKKLREIGIDFACTVTPSFRGLAMLLLADIPVITVPCVHGGYSPYETWSYRLLRNFVIVKPHAIGSYAPRENLRLLEPLGILTDDTRKYLGFSARAQERASQILGSKSISELFVGISPAAGNKIKEWGADKFADLANQISKYCKARVVIFGARGDEPVVKRMTARLNKNISYIDTTGKLNLDELKAVISRLDAFIAVDTGPIYIAEAFGVPTVDIVGPVDENVQPPHGPRHAIVKANVPGYPFLRIMNARVYDERGAQLATEKITVGMVMNGFKKLYGA